MRINKKFELQLTRVDWKAVGHSERWTPDREIRLPKRPEPHIQYLSNEEDEKIKGVIPIHTFTGLRLRVLVEVLLGTGLHISEALSLDRTPFEMGQNEIEIVGKGTSFG